MEDRLKRLRHKCKYMGMHENDVIFARFSERYLGELSEQEVTDFEIFIAENDVDIFKWITGKLEVPSKYDHSVLAKLRECQEYVQV